MTPPAAMPRGIGARAERWHIGQLVMATLLSLSVAVAIAFGLVLAADRIYISDAEMRGEIVPRPDSVLRTRLAARWDELATETRSEGEIEAQLEQEFGLQRSFAARDRKELQKTGLNGLAVCAFVVAVGVVFVWWWRWFGARATQRGSQ